MNEYPLKAERRERRKKNRRFPVHGRSLEHVMQAISNKGRKWQTRTTPSRIAGATTKKGTDGTGQF